MLTPKIKRALRTLRNIVLFGTRTRRRSVRFLGAAEVFVDTEDNRGKEVLALAGVTQPRATLFWRLAVATFQPTIALDIGANYGEIALCTQYPAHTDVLLFEANPMLTPYLARSIETHPAKTKIRLISKLVSDQTGTQEFFVDKKWSGTSSAVGPIADALGSFKGTGPEQHEKIAIQSTTIDEMFRQRALSSDTILFKIDVEGFEPRVLAGMKSTLSQAARFVGILEFDLDYLDRGGGSPENFLDELKSIAHVFTLKDWKFVKVENVGQLPVHSDIFVTSDAALLPKINWPMFCGRLIK